MANPVAPAGTPAAPASIQTQTQTSNQVSTPNQNQNPPPQTAEERYFAVVVDGEKQRFTEEQAKKLLSKAGYADRTVRQTKEALKAIRAAEAERAAQLEAARGNPAELLKLHGMGPRAIGILRQALAERGLSFADG